MSKKNEAQSISNFAEIEVRLARKSIAEFAANPKMTLKDALLCLGAVKSHLDRAGVFHERFNFIIGEQGTCDIKKAKGVLRFVQGGGFGGNRNIKKLIAKTHHELNARMEGK